MRLHCVLYATAVAVLTSATPAYSQSATAESKESLGKISNQYICMFDRSMPGSQVRNEAAKAAGPVLGQVLHSYEHSIKGFAVRTAVLPNGRNAVAEMRAANPRITGCEQDQTIKAVGGLAGAPPGGGGGGGAQSTPWGISRVGGPGSGAGHTAWIIDTGVQIGHPDLPTLDTTASVSYVGGGNDDKNGHGTHVAGTIAAANNSIGVVGVAPGARIVSVRVLGAGGTGSNSGVIAGVDYVGANAASGDVANMSLGGSVSNALDQAVLGASQQSGAYFALAAGNESDDANNHSPARAGGASSTDKVLTVSAFGQANDKFASFSNYGNPPISWSEPGVSILSTYKNSGYATLSGTSMATPHLAGLLISGGVKADGTVTGDADSTPDSIGHR